MTNLIRVQPRVLCAFLALAILGSGCGKRSEDSQSNNIKNHPAVTALGRVTPGRAVISIAAQSGSRILKLEVTDGKKVKTGDALAYLDMYTLRKAELDAAKVALEESWERLESETAYAHAVVDENREAMHVLEVGLDHETKEMARFATLLSSKTIQQQSYDEQKFRVQSRQGELEKAKADLRSAEAALARIPSTVGLKSAEARVKSAEAELELTIIRAPIDGEILQVLTYPGERIGNDPILKMGDTNDMHVIAEVYETDVGMVRVGQHATITGEALAEPVYGVVDEVGTLIYKNNVLDLDPRATKDTRIVEVRIKLDKPQSLSGLTYLEVSTRIDVNTPVAHVKTAAR